MRQNMTLSVPFTNPISASDPSPPVRVTRMHVPPISTPPDRMVLSFLALGRFPGYWVARNE